MVRSARSGLDWKCLAGRVGLGHDGSGIVRRGTVRQDRRGKVGRGNVQLGGIWTGRMGWVG